MAKSAAKDGPSGVFAGAVTLDVHHLLHEYPRVNTKVLAEDMGLYAGGPAANAAVTFSHLGGRARLYSIAGKHELTGAIREDLQGRGVEFVDLSPDRLEPPLVSSILSTGNDRTVVTSPPPPGTDALPEDFAESADILLVDGFFSRLAVAAAAEARRRGVTVVLDGGSWKAVHPELLPFVDVAVCSADFHPPGTSTLDEAFDVLEEHGVHRCAATRGEKAVVYRDKGKAGEIAVPSVEVVDTLGAGDVFHGAFCFALAGGAAFPDALRSAGEVASASCRSFGTRTWMDHPD